ncbi:MAG: SpoIID/LytB domain-containing protein [Elusimicrobiota bacterium]
MKRSGASILALACLLQLPAPSAAPEAAPLPTRITESIIAVGIVHRAANLLLRPIGNFSVIDQSTGELQKLKHGTQYLVEADESQRLIIGKHLFFGPTRLLPGQPGEHVLIENRKYRGNILLQPNKDATVTAIDEMGIEEYLLGVLPKEMNPEWPLEALKAQAVVARTFALNNLGKFSTSGYDLSDDSFSQIYSGLEVESERVQRAVRETAGQVLAWNGKRLEVYFHSTCGGHTIDPATAWGTELSSRPPKPLRGVRDRYCRYSPSYQWETHLASDDILRHLDRHGISAARLTDIRVGRERKHGHASALELKLDGKWKKLSTHRFRLWVNPAELKSTHIRAITRQRNGFLFKGRGYGHGVGLCQWGARVQAVKGRGYRKILEHYFPGASIIREEL